MKSSQEKKGNQSSMPRIWKGKDGCTYIQRKGHIFEYKRKKYRNGELTEYAIWRATVTIDGKAYWTSNKDKEVVEKWLENILKLYGRKNIKDYGKREAPKRVKAKYGPPIRVRGDGE